jgi:hypothetical protein
MNRLDKLKHLHKKMETASNTHKIQQWGSLEFFEFVYSLESEWSNILSFIDAFAHWKSEQGSFDEVEKAFQFLKRDNYLGSNEIKRPAKT